MHTEFDEFDKSPKGESFHDLWLGQSDSTIVDSAPMAKKADFAGMSVERAVQDRSYVGTGLVSETLELRRHIKALMDDKYVYPQLEAILKQQGYSVINIRQQFQDTTGIDPVVAFMDVEMYSKPPAELPRYNYGWGEAKNTNKKGTYYFVLPYTLYYAVWEQQGIDRKVFSEHPTLTEARQALAKVVTDSKDVDPQTVVHILNPLIRIAGLSMAAKAAYHKLVALPQSVPMQHKQAYLEDAVVSGAIEESEAKVVAECLEPVPVVKEAAPEQDDFDKYRDSVEQMTLDEATENMKVPQRGFDSHLEETHQLSTLEATQKAFSKLEEISKQIQGYVINPVQHEVDLKDVEFFADEGREKVNSGHISFVVEIQNKAASQKASALLIMFIVNGDLMWAGTLKGSNNKEYALSQQGIDSYFQDLQGSSLEQVQVLPNATENNPSSPEMAPLRY